MKPLPFEIIDALIQCFGRSFHFKDNVETFFISCGVNRSLAQKYRNEPKFVWARKLLSELNETEDGRNVLQRILTDICTLNKLPDTEVPDPDAGLQALRRVKKLAYENDLLAKKSRTEGEKRKSVLHQKVKIIEERVRKLKDVNEKFKDAIKNPNRQQAGYSLEDLIKELFAIFEIDYRKSYRTSTSTQQIDGHFSFKGFNYLVEARWRQDQPTEIEIGGFKHKVDVKLRSTRGIFVSINGFRSEVINQFTSIGSNIIFFSGEDLAFILEGRIDLHDALIKKIEKASQEGEVYVSLH